VSAEKFRALAGRALARLHGICEWRANRKVHRLQLVNHDEAKRSYGRLLQAEFTIEEAKKRSPIRRRCTNKLLTGAELL
jgi:hypothetical protein